MFVKDYKGDLIPKERARRIKNENGIHHYYESGVSCIKMDDGKWYRVTTGKIIFDHSIGKWVHSDKFHGNSGLIGDGTLGSYSDISQEVIVNEKIKKEVREEFIFDLTNGAPNNSEPKRPSRNSGSWVRKSCINAEVAVKLGYRESIYDGMFYKTDQCNSEELARMTQPNIPNGERVSVYSLDDDKDYRGFLEDKYDNNNLKVEPKLELMARRYVPFSFGIEVEVQNGYVPKRIREKLGFRNCRDGSLDTGIELVSIPMEGGKGLQTIKEMCKELTFRTQLSNKCSVHLHFGDVRRDKLYVLSLWTLLRKIQDELRQCFPYSRTNSIREDGKIYAALLPDLGLNVKDLLSISDEDDFKKRIVSEFSKVYTYLNDGHPPGETYDEQFIKDTREFIIKGKTVKKYCYRTKFFNYTTKLPHHAVAGPKWNRKSRYHHTNFLNLFFAHSKTIEFRISEATTNFDKILMLLLLDVAILKYAENFQAVFTNNKITIKEVLADHFSKTLSESIYKYWVDRKKVFVDDGQFRANWKLIEAAYMASDKKFTLNL